MCHSFRKIVVFLGLILFANTVLAEEIAYFDFDFTNGGAYADYSQVGHSYKDAKGYNVICRADEANEIFDLYLVYPKNAKEDGDFYVTSLYRGGLFSTTVRFSYAKHNDHIFGIGSHGHAKGRCFVEFF